MPILGSRFTLHIQNIQHYTFSEAECVALAGQTPGGVRVVLDFSLLLSLHQGKESKEQPERLNTKGFSCTIHSQYPQASTAYLLFQINFLSCLPYILRQPLQWIHFLSWLLQEAQIVAQAVAGSHIECSF